MFHNTSSLRADARLRAPSLPLQHALTALILIAAALVQARGGLNLDVSWFITFAERVYSGAIAYIDVSDPNPPASIMIYVPAIALSQWTGLKIEALVVAMTLLMATAAARSTSAYDPTASRWTYLATLVGLTIAPGAMFAEREHYAAIAAIPATSAMLAAANGQQLTRHLRMIAGGYAALIVAFKPHFAAGLAIPAIYATIRRRSLAWISPAEFLSCLILLAAYVGASYIAYPAYFTDALPEAIRLYSAAHASIEMGVTSEAMWFGAAISLSALFVAFSTTLSRVATGAALSAFGFMIAGLAQQKYQINHASAAVALATIPLIEASLCGRISNIVAKAMILTEIVLAPLVMRAHCSLAQTAGEPAMVEAIKTLLPPNGRLAAISDNIETMFPAARNTGATWVYHYNSMYRSGTARWLRDHQTGVVPVDYLNQVIADDRAVLVQDIVLYQPDVLIIDNAEIRAREFAVPAIAAAMANYEMARTVTTATTGEAELWVRKIDSRQRSGLAQLAMN